MQRFLIYRRDPFVMWVLAFLILGCGTALLSGTRPGSLEALMPSWYWYGWVVTTLAAAVLYTFGIFTRNLLNGLFLTRSLCPILATSVTAIGVAQIWVGGSKAIISALIITSVGAAFMAQYRQLTKIVRSLPKKNGG